MNRAAPVHRRGRGLPGVLGFGAERRAASDGASRPELASKKCCQAAKALACPFDTRGGRLGEETGAERAHQPAR